MWRFLWIFFCVSPLWAASPSNDFSSTKCLFECSVKKCQTIPGRAQACEKICTDTKSKELVQKCLAAWKNASAQNQKAASAVPASQAVPVSQAAAASQTVPVSQAAPNAVQKKSLADFKSLANRLSLKNLKERLDKGNPNHLSQKYLMPRDRAEKWLENLQFTPENIVTFSSYILSYYKKGSPYLALEAQAHKLLKEINSYVVDPIPATGNVPQALKDIDYHMYVPKSFYENANAHPPVLFVVYGGGDQNDFYPTNQDSTYNRLAHLGFIVVVLNGEALPGEEPIGGFVDSLRTNHTNFPPRLFQDIQDVYDALSKSQKDGGLYERPYIDKRETKTFLYGGSFGGYVTALAATTPGINTLFDGFISWAGVYDRSVSQSRDKSDVLNEWQEQMEKYDFERLKEQNSSQHSSYFRENYVQNQKYNEEISPLYRLKDLQKPFLVMAGTQDVRVNPLQELAFMERALKEGKSHLVASHFMRREDHYIKSKNLFLAILDFAQMVMDGQFVSKPELPIIQKLRHLSKNFKIRRGKRLIPAEHPLEKAPEVTLLQTIFDQGKTKDSLGVASMGLLQALSQDAKAFKSAFLNYLLNVPKLGFQNTLINLTNGLKSNSELIYLLNLRNFIANDDNFAALQKRMQSYSYLFPVGKISWLKDLKQDNEQKLAAQVNQEISKKLEEFLNRDVLDLTSEKIDDAGTQALAKVIADPKSKITTLYLFRNQIGDAGAQALAAVLPNSKITKLYLSYNQIGDAGAQALASILPASKITELDLSENQIGDAGAQALAKVLADPNSKITGLYLLGNQIGDAGAQALASILPASKITEVYLFGNQIGDAGAQALAKVLADPNSKITGLYLLNNPISDATKKTLTEIQEKWKKEGRTLMF